MGNLDVRLEAIADRQDATRVVVAGELDVGTVDILSRAFSDAIGEGARRVEVDTSNLEFVDSSGLSAVIAASNELRGTGGRLVITELGVAMERLLTLTGLTAMLTSDE